MAAERKRGQGPYYAAIPLAHGGTQHRPAKGAQADKRIRNCINRFVFLYFSSSVWHNYRTKNRLKPVYDRLHRELLSREVLHAIEQRLKQAKPVLDALWSWASIRNAAPKSALGKALTYLKEQWPYLTNYLKDGRLEISNNRAERSIKPFVIDRKNFLFANTPKGAAGSAVMFSLIRTAMEYGLDPYKYLTHTLRVAARMDLTKAENVAALLPENAPLECRNSAPK